MGDRMRRWLEHLAETNEQTFGVNGIHCGSHQMDHFGHCDGRYVKAPAEIAFDQIAAGFLPFEPLGAPPDQDQELTKSGGGNSHSEK